MIEPLHEGPIVTGNGVHGPLMLTVKGYIVTTVGIYSRLEFAAKFNESVLVHDGPGRNPVFVPAIGLSLAKMRGTGE